MASLYVCNFQKYYLFSMSIEDKLTLVKECLGQEKSIVFKSISSNRSPSDSNLLKTCLYHMKSLNQSIIGNGNFDIKENKQIQLPKITNIQAKIGYLPTASASMLHKSASFFTDLLDKSKQNSDDRLQKILVSPASLRNILISEQKKIISDKPKIPKKPKFKHLFIKPDYLKKQQRYFQNEPVKINAARLQNLGYYEGSNVYKAKNIESELKQMQVVASKPIAKHHNLLAKQDFFITNSCVPIGDFCMEEFIESELNKERKGEKIIKQCDQSRYPRELSLTESQKQEESIHSASHQLIQSDLYITIKDYSFFKDDSFKVFKAKYIQVWGDILLAFENICRCMKHLSISFLKIKSDKLLLWSGKKSTLDQMTKMLGLQGLRKPIEKIERVCIGFLDRLKVCRMRQKIARKDSLARWVVSRLQTFTYLRKLKRQRLQRAYKLHRELQAQMDWDCEIHLPSFSVDEFKRNTTQYLQSFENIYHSIWKNSHKHLILILPTLNQNILKLLQARIQVKRSLTIICPEVHEIFPSNLSLAAQVFFSPETLYKIKNAISGKKTILIPGFYEDKSHLEYQMLLSDHLNIPLFCSLDINNNIRNQRLFFDDVGIDNPKHWIINPNSNYQDILLGFCQLFAHHVEEKKWIIKLQGEFKGRGIATIKINPSKYLKKQDSIEKKVKILYEHIKNNFKLKVKINFQNSLFMVQDFFKQLQLKGGVIEQIINSNTTFQICFRKHCLSQFQYLYKVYGTDYSNKAWLSSDPTPELQLIINKIQNYLDQSNHLGIINVTICRDSQGRVYGVDVKPYQTYTSSLVSFINMMEEKRRRSHEQAININKLPTRRIDDLQEPNIKNQLIFCNHSYLAIPNLVFTDIDEEVKARLIEQMMSQCWNDRHLKLNDECRVFLSLGLDFSIIFMGKDIRRLKKKAIHTLRELNDKTSSYRMYRGKEVTRDVFQYGDIIRAISQIKE